MGLFPDHDVARIFTHQSAVLFDAARFDLDDAPLGFGPGLARFQDFGFGVQGVAGKHRVGQDDIIPAQVEAVFADIGHAQPGHNRQGQHTVDQTLAELGLFAVLGIEMDLVGVIGQQSKPDIIVFGHRPAEPTAVHVPDLEILIITTFPTGFDWHSAFLLSTNVGFPALYHAKSGQEKGPELWVEFCKRMGIEDRQAQQAIVPEILQCAPLA